MSRLLSIVNMGAGMALACFLAGCSQKKLELDTLGVKPIQLGEFGLVYRLAFSPDSRRLAVCGDMADKGFSVWDLEEKREIFVKDGRNWAIAFSPDGKTLAVDGNFEPGSYLTLWDTTTWKQRETPQPTDLHAATWLGFHPTEPLLFMAGSPQKRGDCFFLVWDLKAMKERYRKDAHKFGFDDLALSPDGRVLVTGGSDDTGKVWDTVTGEPLWSFVHPGPGGANRALCVAFLPDGTAFATGGNDGKVRLWDLTMKKEKAVLAGKLVYSRRMAVSPDGKLILVGGLSGSGKETVELWDLATHKLLGELSVPHLSCIGVSPDGKWLAAAWYDQNDSKHHGAVYLWDLPEVTKKARESDSIPQEKNEAERAEKP